ncbi:MAG: hypothetical protein AB7U20_02165 [Planctomycetaceae bacterium]
MKICIAPSRVLSSPKMGGHAWVYFNWTLGFQDCGCNVVWLERFHPAVAAADALFQLRRLRENFDALGVSAEIALVMSPEQQAQLHGVVEAIRELTVPLHDAIAESDLLVNFYYALEPELLCRFKQTALLDIDPGLLQHWIKQRQLKVGAHDWYFTTGETVGGSESRVPDCGLNWLYTPPVVDVKSWPVVSADAGSCYTTVSNWWAEWETIEGETFSNEKRTSFLDYLDLPANLSAPLELALCLTDAEQTEREALRRKDWHLQDAWRICETPTDYRGYIQQSRGEFSCAKPSCLRLQNAWISDRTLCYLASGKPAIVQHTGASRILPDGDGLFRYRNLQEAVNAFEQVEGDYERHCRTARLLATEYFDATKVVGRFLERITP